VKGVREMGDLREGLAYVAGIFDGEGSFSVQAPSRGRSLQPRAVVKMTDLDVLEWCKESTGLGKVWSDKLRPGERKASYVWTVAGFPQVQAFVAMVWPWLCGRRKVKAREILLQGRGRSKSQARQDWLTQRKAG
jgi:hypothetical protein